MRKDRHAKGAGYRDRAGPDDVGLVVTTVRRDEYERPAWVDRLLASLSRLLRRPA